MTVRKITISVDERMAKELERFEKRGGRLRSSTRRVLAEALRRERLLRLLREELEATGGPQTAEERAETRRLLGLDPEPEAPDSGGLDE
jgi:hypothetical protein